jgi:hypothetical protein
MASRPMTEDDVFNLIEMIGYGDLLFEGTCHDCGKDMAVRLRVTDYDTGAYEVDGGSLWISREYKKEGDELLIYTKMKCDECFDKDPFIRDQECEVYTRIVGYLRPISQWNPGKKAEYAERKMFKAEDSRE